MREFRKAQNPRLRFGWRRHVGPNVDFQPAFYLASGASVLLGSVAVIAVAHAGAVDAFCTWLRRQRPAPGEATRKRKLQTITTFPEQHLLPA